MHELSLCEEIVRLIEARAEADHFDRVIRVHLAIGDLSCVDPDALRFAFTATTRGTMVEGATLSIDRVAGRAWCAACRQSVSVAQRYDACPECGTAPLEITGGTEMKIIELEVE